MSKKNEEKLTLKEEIRVENAIALSQQQEKSLAKPELTFADDFEQFQDHFDKGSTQIPFIRILQANSPVCTPGEPTYQEEARPGMYFNTVTAEFSKKIEVIPVYHYSTFIEWVPRNEGGGFVKDHGFDEGSRLLATCTKRPDSNRDMLSNGNDLIRTEVYFILQVRDDGTCEQAMITMTSTQLKKARNWNSRTRMKVIDVPGRGKTANCPMFFHSYYLTTVPEKNDFGNWMGYVIEDGRPTLQISEGAYQLAKQFRLDMESGLKSGKVSVKNVGEETTEKAEVPF